MKQFALPARQKKKMTISMFSGNETEASITHLLTFIDNEYIMNYFKTRKE